MFVCTYLTTTSGCWKEQNNALTACLAKHTQTRLKTGTEEPQTRLTNRWLKLLDKHAKLAVLTLVLLTVILLTLILLLDRC